jgi:hypothetical protein
MNADEITPIAADDLSGAWGTLNNAARRSYRRESALDRRSSALPKLFAQRSRRRFS